MKERLTTEDLKRAILPAPISFGKLAGVAAFLIPVAYVLGYIAWGFYELSQGTGQLPVGPERYLSSGVSILGALGLAIAAFTLGWLIQNATVVRRSEVIAKAALAVLLGVYLALTVSAFHLESILSDGVRRAFGWILVAALGIGILLPVVTPHVPRAKHSSQPVANLGRGAVYLIAMLMLLGVAVSWGTSVLPNLAQELGGARPECATLVVPALFEINNETREIEASILYRDDSVVVLREQGFDWLRPVILSSESVLVIAWC